MLKELKKDDIIYRINTKNNKYEEISLIHDLRKTLSITRDGFNMYLVDGQGENTIDILKKEIREILKNRNPPRDICLCVLNDEKYPKAIYLENGKGIILKEFLEEMKKNFLEEINSFYLDTNLKSKENLLNKMNKEKDKILEEISQFAIKEDFSLILTEDGIGFMPVVEGRTLTNKEYLDLGFENIKIYEVIIEKLKNIAKDKLLEVSNIENRYTKKLKILLKNHLEKVKKKQLKKLMRTFKDEKTIHSYIIFVAEEIIKSTVETYSLTYEENEESLYNNIYKYSLNVLVDNSKEEYPKIIYTEDLSVKNLIGNIEYEIDNNNYKTNVNLVKAGVMLSASDGVLIIKATSLIEDISLYKKFKTALYKSEVKIEAAATTLESIYTSSVEIERIKINLKVILVGDYETYETLFNYDSDFKDIFRIKSNYNRLLDISEETVKKVSLIVEEYRKENSLIFNNKKEIVYEIIKYLSRLAEDRNKIYYCYEEIVKIIELSEFLRKENGKMRITKKEVLEVIYKEDFIEKSYLLEFRENQISILLEGSKIGQINGLSVILAGDISFGNPLKISCICSKGQGDIIDVQKENELSGKVHSKSISILRGILHWLFKSYSYLPVNFYLAFEQFYGNIEGDSASVAEFLAIISSLSKLPIKQNFAVTGSLNQFGEVQPIGGVNEKIEGFYKVCKLTSSIKGKGVVIPIQNLQALVLSKEVEDSISKGEFKIYTIKTIFDAIELLIGSKEVSSGKIIEKCKYEMDCYR